MTIPVSETRRFFKPLTGLRFIAALMVFFAHLAPREFSPFINQFFTELQAGVPVFFVLSGFLLCHRYYDKLTKVKGAFSTYIRNRIVRIYPMYLIIGIGNIIWLNMDLKTAALNITFLHGFFSAYVFTPLPHTWSLTVEITFYALLPLIFIMLSKRIGILLQFVLFVSTGLLLTFLFGIINIKGFWFDIPNMLVLTFFGRCFEFLVGIKIALLLRDHSTLISQKFNFTYVGIVLVTGAISVMAIIGNIFSYPGIFVHNLILPICIAFVIIGLLTEKTLISKLLSTKLFVLLGNSSYAFFLIHYGWWQKFVFNYVVKDFVLNLLLTILAGIVLYLLIEKPIVSKLKKNM